MNPSTASGSPPFHKGGIKGIVFSYKPVITAYKNVRNNQRNVRQINGIAFLCFAIIGSSEQRRNFYEYIRG